MTLIAYCAEKNVYFVDLFSKDFELFEANVEGIEISLFNFIQQKSRTSISGEMNIKLLSIQWWVQSPTE